MGTAYSSVLDTAESEFVRVQGVERPELAAKHVTYLQLRQMRQVDDYAVNTKHIAILYALDAGRDGCFSYDDLRGFINFAASAVKSRDTESPSEFSAMLQARCLLRLWKDCASDGNDVFADWLLLMIERTYPRQVRQPPTRHVGGSPNEDFFGDTDSDLSDSPNHVGLDDLARPQTTTSTTNHNSDDDDDLTAAEEPPGRSFGPACVALIYDLLQINAVYGIDLNSFAAMLRGADAATNAYSPPEEQLQVPEGIDDVEHDDEDDTSRSIVFSSFDAPESGNSDEELAFDEAPLRAFLNAFAETMWRTLGNLGLQVLIGRAGGTAM